MGRNKDKAGNKDKVRNKKQQKYAQIDNNYLTFDKDITNSMIMCGIATGVSCMVFGTLPIAVILFMMAIIEKTQRYITQSVFILIICGIGVIGSLVTSIIAKSKYRKSKWAVTNIVYISINLVISGLLSWFFIWFIVTYGAD